MCCVNPEARGDRPARLRSYNARTVRFEVDADSVIEIGRGDMAKTQRNSHYSDPNIYKVIHRYSWKEYPATIITLLLMVSITLVLMAFSFIVLSDFKRALLAIVAIILALLLGWTIASLLSPITVTEENRFPRILSTIGGVVSGFTLAKIGDIVSFIRDNIPNPVGGNPIELSFFLLAPLTCVLVGLLSAFVWRNALMIHEENRLQVYRRKLHEAEEAASRATGP
jgi:hypothetical protein